VDSTEFDRVGVVEPFRIREVAPSTGPRAAEPAPPPLGPLVNFAGAFAGLGLNTIFRPDNAATQTPMPNPVTPGLPRDNVLEINLTSETLTFSPSLGSVPNRGEVQRDIFLNGVPYLQKINDVTVPSQPVGIHFEPGLWMAVPVTTKPAINEQTLVRMASIPHGTTIEAQGTSVTIAGKPNIPAQSITPFPIGDPNHPLPPFASQAAADPNTPRIPQDLSPFIAAGTITQTILDNPNIILANHIATQTITSTTTIIVATAPAAPLFGGGTANIAFLLGDATATTPNADAVSMKAVFWIETVQYTIQVPIWYPGQPYPIIPAPTGDSGQPIPKFKVIPSRPILAPEEIEVKCIQIQYSQLVLLNFNDLSWPHVSVATLVPQDPIPVAI
jgi:hypothetical protein